MRSCSRLIIGGSWVEPLSTATLEVVEAHSQRVVGRVSDGSGWFR